MDWEFAASKKLSCSQKKSHGRRAPLINFNFFTLRAGIQGEGERGIEEKRTFLPPPPTDRMRAKRSKRDWTFRRSLHTKKKCGDGYPIFLPPPPKLSFSVEMGRAKEDRKNQIASLSTTRPKSERGPSSSRGDSIVSPQRNRISPAPL